MKLEKKGKFGPNIYVNWYKSPTTKSCFPVGILSADIPDITDGFGLLSSAISNQMIMAKFSHDEWRMGLSGVNKWDEGCLNFEIRINNFLSRDDLRYVITHFVETEHPPPVWPILDWTKPLNVAKEFVRDITVDRMGKLETPFIGIEYC
ncbi:MAG: hypothetical protein ACI875_002201, partial [Planctomycetota bacterium]